MNIKELKVSARENLKGNYGPFASVILVFLLLGGISTLIAKLVSFDVLSVLLMAIVGALLFMGIIHMGMKVANKEKVKLGDLLARTDLCFKYLGIYIILALVGALLGLLGGITLKSLMIVIANVESFNVIVAILLMTFGMLLAAAIIAFAIYVCINFSQVWFILYEEPKEKLKNIFTKSFDMMEGRVLEYILLCLSFVGWAILAIFTLGLLYFWLFPYMLVTLANYYNKIKGEKEDTDIKEVVFDEIEVPSEPEIVFDFKTEEQEEVKMEPEVIPEEDIFEELDDTSEDKEEPKNFNVAW